MTERFCYYDNDTLCLDGFAFSIGDGRSHLEMVPTLVLWPKIGAKNENVIVLSVRVHSDRFSGCVEFDVLASCLWQLATDLRGCKDGTRTQLEFPSRSCVILHETAVKFMLSRRGQQYELQCTLADPALTQNDAELQQSPSQMTLMSKMQIDTECIDVAIDQLDSLYRCLERERVRSEEENDKNTDKSN